MSSYKFNASSIERPKDESTPLDFLEEIIFDVKQLGRGKIGDKNFKTKVY